RPEFALQWGIDDWNALKSDELRGYEDDRKSRVDAAEGEWAKAGTAFWETIKNPMLLTSFIAEQAPMMLPVGGVGRVAGMATKGLGYASKAGKVATGAAVGTGAVMQGADAGSQAYDQLMELPDEIWNQDPDISSGSTTKEQRALDLSRNAAIASGISSVGLNMIPGARIFEKQLAGVKLPGGSRITNALAGFAGETIQEAGEEGFGAYAANVATKQVDPSTDEWKGVGEAAGLGAAGGIFGGIAGAAAQPGPTIEEQTEHVVKR
ncbi:unnamed protein product, partial [marine sediment metagenome]